jgi:hypothetical protein
MYRIMSSIKTGILYYILHQGVATIYYLLCAVHKIKGAVQDRGAVKSWVSSHGVAFRQGLPGGCVRGIKL